MNIVPLFSYPLVEYKIDDIDSENILSQLKKEKYNQTEYSILNPTEIKVSISKNLNILNKFPSLKRSIENSLQIYIVDVLQYKNIKYKLTNSWSTLTPIGGVGQRHMHSNSWISGIYYPHSIESGGEIRFYSRKISHFSLCKPEEYNIFNSNVWDINPLENTLLLFDSCLEHSIQKNFSNTERYSIAFNILPYGRIGDGDSSINIHIN